MIKEKKIFFKKEMITEVLEIKKEKNIDYPTCHYYLKS